MRVCKAVAGLLVFVVALLQAIPAGASTSTTLQTGFVDQALMGSTNRDVWLERGATIGATRVRLAFTWASVAPTSPPADQSDSAAWVGYRFANVDAQVRSAAAKGFSAMLSVSGAPNWAASVAGRPKSISPSAWKPDPVAFGSFMHALAERYSGSFPDPLKPGETLPRVQQFQIWNEPNLNLYLAPQYENGQPWAAIRFRELLNAGYAAVKSVQPDATVIAAGLAPYGDPGTKPARTRPILFLRQMLCLNDALQKACSDSTRADVFSLHPYEVGPPSKSAYDGDDATIPDVPRLQNVLAKARKAGTLGPRLPKVWITEFQYESSPPDPQGIPIATRARYISETLWRLWRAGVPVVFWYLLQDQAPTPSYASTYQSGFFLQSGQRKADAKAFRLPLMVTSKGPTKLNVWLRTPFAGTVSVQVRRGGKWRTAVRLRHQVKDGVVTTRVPRGGVTAVRAVAGVATSWPWAL